MTTDIVLWLDLAGPIHQGDDAVHAKLPAGAPVLRLTDHGVEACPPRGTPVRWRPVLDAIDQMVRKADRIGAPGCRYWVTGRAGLPAFVHLGWRLSKWKAVTIVHQPQDASPAIVMPLDGDRADGGAPYFERTPRRVSQPAVGVPVALAISSENAPQDDHMQRALTSLQPHAGHIVHAHRAGQIAAEHMATAKRELEYTVREICDAHPRRSTLALFVRGPTPLAFLAGAAINPNVCRDVQVFEFDGAGYRLAFELPHPPVPDRARLLFLWSAPTDAKPLAPEDELRAIHLKGDSALAERIALDVAASARPLDLLDGLRRFEPNIVHFSGHGGPGALAFEDDGGKLRCVSTEDVVAQFRLAGDSVRLVVLSACYSDELADALLPFVDCMVCMRGTVLDPDATRFAATLYRRLAEGDSVQDAFEEALLTMRLARPAPKLADSTRSEAPQLIPRDVGLPRTTYLVRKR